MTKQNKTKLIKPLKEASKAGRLTDETKKRILADLSLRKTKAESNVKTVVIDLKEVADELGNANLISGEILSAVKQLDKPDPQPFDDGLIIETLKSVKEETRLVRDDLEKAQENQQKLKTKEVGDWMVIVGSLFSNLTTFLSRLVKISVFNTKPVPEAYTTPQMVMLYDPHRKSMADLKSLGTSGGHFSVNIPGSLGVKNKAGASVNPATEETLQDVLAALGGGATTVVSGNKNVTTPGTAVSLVSSSTPCKKLTIRTKNTNTGYIYVGDSSIDSTGFYLGPQDSIVISIDDVNKVYIDADTGGEGVVFIYEN